MLSSSQKAEEASDVLLPSIEDSNTDDNTYSEAQVFNAAFFDDLSWLDAATATSASAVPAFSRLTSVRRSVSEPPGGHDHAIQDMPQPTLVRQLQRNTKPKKYRAKPYAVTRANNGHQHSDKDWQTIGHALSQQTMPAVPIGLQQRPVIVHPTSQPFAQQMYGSSRHHGQASSVSTEIGSTQGMPGWDSRALSQLTVAELRQIVFSAVKDGLQNVLASR